MRIRENIPLSELTTMRLGGPAHFVIDIDDKADIPAAFAFAEERHLPTFILGKGANTIAHDEGFDGVVIMSRMSNIRRGFAMHSESLIREGEIGDFSYVRAYGGTDWDDLVAYTVKRGLTGIEALSKIPGTAGAAPVQNIGAYGQDLSQVFVSAQVYDTKDRTFKTLTHADMHFTYRHSILNTTEKGRYYVASITLELKEGQMSRPFYNSIEKYLESHPTDDFSPESIRRIVSEIRKNKLPDPADQASAGSFFKNVYLTPEQAAAAEKSGIPVYHGHDGLKINSGWLIEQCDLKGQLLHGMRISPHAALVLINESATGYADLATARAEIRAAVKAKFGYDLEQEPVEISSISRTGDTTGGTPTESAGNMGEKARSGPVRHSTKLLNGKELADFIKERQRAQVAAMPEKPHLHIIYDNPSPVIEKYIALKKHYGEDIGATVTVFQAHSTAEISKEIQRANQDPSVHGLILQLPITDKAQTDALTAEIAPEKDVDGLNQAHSNFDSATATAILWLLAGYDIDLKSAKIAIVGRGKLVGAPLYQMFTASNYNVTLFHKGDDLTNLQKFDTIITATGVPGLISSAFIAPGTTLIDAGTASEKGLIKGDLALDLRQRADLKAITPEKGGVGPLTVTCLFDHLIQAASSRG